VEAFGRIAVGLGCAALVFACGVIAGVAGAVTCHEDVGSADRAPQLCASAGSSPTLWLPALVGPACVLVLLIARPRIRTIACTTVALLALEATLVAMWGLVSYGTLSY
jgi:hypothetical protein